MFFFNAKYKGDAKIIMLVRIFVHFFISDFSTSKDKIKNLLTKFIKIKIDESFNFEYEDWQIISVIFHI